MIDCSKRTSDDMRWGSVSMRKIVLFSGLVLVSGLANAAVEVAKVNGKAITDADIVSSLSGMNESQRKNYLKDTGARREVLSSLIDREVLSQEGEKANFEIDEDYKRSLELFRKGYLASRALNQNLSSKVTEGEARKYFDRNKLRYSTQQAYVQHILLDTEAKAEEVLKKAKQSGADFQELAVQYSKDPSAKNNRGEIGPVGWDSPFVLAFKDAALLTKEGAISAPVHTQFGYHLIKVLKRKPGKAMNYDEVELQVKADLRRELAEDFVYKLKQNAKVSIDDTALNKF